MTSTSTLPAAGRARLQDRRCREPRVGCNREISILPCGQQESFVRAHLSDCSAHGLGITVKQKMEPGQQILTRIDINDQPTLLMYTIRYCIPIQTDEFRAGARFSGFAASKFKGQMDAVIARLSA